MTVDARFIRTTVASTRGLDANRDQVLTWVELEDGTAQVSRQIELVDRRIVELEERLHGVADAGGDPGGAEQDDAVGQGGADALLVVLDTELPLINVSLADLLDVAINTPDGAGGLAEWDVIYYITVTDNQTGSITRPVNRPCSTSSRV